ncbi:hypothetical protein M378DRAFT_69148 [Amanita muscaria Koide BX008]|uniref:AB hydrolase-1 domain-containing protein n=1 Tax=Amanita muscaria (strain Koide BX008) TaxID=946122 RepID=A0A0C2TQN9_AMAMK|nr:hypothetical protein M378DRAFT_69148 [Amanita muscaria Koide BX008]
MLTPPSDATDWRVELSSSWKVLGPFPVHAREQHYLSPAYPIDLSEPIDWSKSWPSSYADGGSVVWTNANSDPKGNINISFPNIRWASLRATEGWAALQYHSVLWTQLTLYPPAEPRELPNLLVQLNQASFFSVTPNHDELPGGQSTTKWYQGNIYNLDGHIPQSVELPTKPSLRSPTTYNLFVSGDYEIRLFGDPRSEGTESPTLRFNLSVEVEEPVEMVIRAVNQDVLCDFVEGIAFGDTIGLGLRSIAGWWTVESVTVLEPPPNSSFSIRLLNEIRIAPSQTRVVPLVITQQAPVFSSELSLFVKVRCGELEQAITVVLPIRQLERWDAQTYEPIKSTYLYPTHAPTHFIAIPPKCPHPQRHCPPILALHGAGVDVVHEVFWADALPRQRNSWIVIPTGRTSWGFDWHGPSAQDAWATIEGLARILDRNEQWRIWRYASNKPVVVLGHSNGGQGAWYLASRYPDRVLGVVPAAAYIKSQAYIPLSWSRSAHFIDPTLRAILESALTPDDNDLHLTNLSDKPICAIHGGDDENVPVWHTREAISVLKTWASSPDMIYREDKGQPHWYSSVFRNDEVQSFLEKVLQEPEKPTPTKFTITTTSPAESGALHGWRIEQLTVPSRLARMQIEKVGYDKIKVSTLNVHLFSLDWEQCSVSSLVVDGAEIVIKDHVPANNVVRIERIQAKGWCICQSNQEDDPYTQQSGRLQLILTATGPITFIIQTKDSYEFSIALRLTHDLQQFHRLDAQILDEQEALQLGHDFFTGQNIVVIGNPAMEFVQRILSFRKTPFSLQGSILTLNGESLLLETFSAALFLHPPLRGVHGLLLFMLSSSIAGLERAMRLFPIRTGVPVPDWILIGRDADTLGAAGVQAAGVWGRQWCWNQMASWTAMGLDRD